MFAELLLKRLQLGLAVDTFPTIEEFLAAEEKEDRLLEEALRAAPPPAAAPTGPAFSPASSLLFSPSLSGRLGSASTPSPSPLKGGSALSAAVPSLLSGSVVDAADAAAVSSPADDLMLVDFSAPAPSEAAAGGEADEKVKAPAHEEESVESLRKDEASVRSLLSSVSVWIEQLKAQLDIAVESEDYEAAGAVYTFKMSTSR